MEIPEGILTPDEQALFRLRQLYRERGYARYKMGKFEEYDLYARNKQFLIDENIITFTDINGKLMALKPDVTLSIIKSTRDDAQACRKVYYNENVYRVPKGEHSFKEIMQAGLECIGTFDTDAIYEVVELAALSLQCLSDDVMLDLSHMGLVSSLISATGIPQDSAPELLAALEAKSPARIEGACTAAGANADVCALLQTLAMSYETPGGFLARYGEAVSAWVPADVWDPFAALLGMIEAGPHAERIRMNFSLVNDVDYYDGFVFTGYVNGIAQRVLSGGQYDGFLRSMGRTDRAIGFAVYLDLLDQLSALGAGEAAGERTGASC